MRPIHRAHCWIERLGALDQAEELAIEQITTSTSKQVRMPDVRCADKDCEVVKLLSDPTPYPRRRRCLTRLSCADGARSPDDQRRRDPAVPRGADPDIRRRR